MPDPFYEDFFERIVDIKWQREKKVFWMAGDTQGPIQNYLSNYYTSNDGIHWSTHPGGRSAAYGSLWGFTCGLWMREGFSQQGRPLWILAGEGITPDGKYRKSGLQISYDGLSFPDTARFFDNGFHFAAQMFVDGDPPNQARLESSSFDHADTFTSSNGISWSPDQYHPDRIGGLVEQAAAPSLLRPTARTIPPPLPPGLERLPVSLSHPEDTSTLDISMLRTVAMPRASDTLDLIKRNDIYQLSNRSSATGTLRKGKFSGRVVTIRGGQGHDFHGPGTPGVTYFDPDCTMSDARTGEFLSASDCGITHCHSIAYGYYVFCIAGDDGGGGPGVYARSIIAHTTDGITWHRHTLGTPAHGMWSLVVGPRPEETTPDHQDPPTGPTGPAPPGPPPRGPTGA